MHDRPARSPLVLWRTLDAEHVLYRRDTGQVHQLDAIGSHVWNLLDGSLSRSELVAEVAAGYAAPFDVIERDVSDLIAELAAAGLLA